MWRAAMRDPLLHFLAAGCLLYAAYHSVRPEEVADEPEAIVVDEAALLEFLQHRARTFEPAALTAVLEAMSQAELDLVVRDFVREEVLYREALALGLDEDDYVIRRRLAQKVEFVTQGFAEAASAVDDEALAAFYEAHAEDYREEPWMTFAHVFVDGEDLPLDALQARAEAKLLALRRDHVAFADAPRHGDRFPYHVNYVERTYDYIADQLGPDAAAALFALEPGPGWQGPVRSPFGAHLVWVVAKREGSVPPLDAIRERVLNDARAASIREQTDAAVDALVAAYDVEVRVKAKDVLARGAGTAPSARASEANP